MNPPAIARSRLLICPVCQLPLEDPDQSGKKLQCGNNHSFDIARQGYIHLLPVQHKKSRSPGDNRAMVQSRQRFLSSGHYEPLANKLGCILQEHLRDTTPLHLLDAGCGEGYYTRYLQAALQQHWPDKTLTVCGIDISKDAIVAACRRSRQITWIVASLKQPPVQPGSFHGLVSIFSPLP
ncbi:MAG: methyltransferase domain-containing protein, partial [Ketobacteraceae bacterium]|nr:methyltransferase domain-containing protein [Ketobacteraceae bacterium]